MYISTLDSPIVGAVARRAVQALTDEFSALDIPILITVYQQSAIPLIVPRSSREESNGKAASPYLARLAKIVTRNPLFLDTLLR